MNYLTFAFDDGYQSWLDAAGKLEEYGWRGTFYTCLRNVVYYRKERRKKMFPFTDVITWGEVKQLKSRGHEIACHGTRHIDLLECTERETRLELFDSLEVFKSHKIPVTTYGCAFNSYPSELPVKALTRYNSFRNWLGVNSVPLKSRIYNVLRAGEAMDEVQMGDDKWVVSAWHDVANTGFEKYLKKISILDNVKVKTVEWMYANTFR